MRIEIDDQSGSNGSAGTTPSLKKPETRLLSIHNLDGVFRARLIDENLRAFDTKKLRAEIVALHAPGKPPLVMLSMQGMENFASGCLGALVQISADLENAGGALVLYNLPKELAKMMKKTRLDRSIQIAKTRSHARKQVLATQKRHSITSHTNAA